MKKILSVILAVCMLCGLVPLTVFAEAVYYDVTVNGLEYTLEEPYLDAVGEDAFDASQDELYLELRSEEGVVISENATVTIGGEPVDNYNYGVWVRYDAETDTTVLELHIGNYEGDIDGDIVITLKEAKMLWDEVDTVTPVEETATYTATYTDTADPLYFMDGDELVWAYEPQVYAVELEAEQQVWVSSFSEADMDGDTKILVFKDEDDAPVCYDYLDFDNVNDLQESDIFTVDADGLYYIVFTHYGEANGTYKNTVQLENIPEDISVLLDEAEAAPAKETITSAKAYVVDGVVRNVYAVHTVSDGEKVSLQADGAGVDYLLFTKDDETGSYEIMTSYTLDPKTETFIDTAMADCVVVYQAQGDDCNVTVKNIKANESAVLDFTADTVPTPGADAKWAWDAATKTLTLKDGFAVEIEEMETEESAALLPEDATVIVDGSAYFFTGDGISSAAGGTAIVGMGNLTVKGAKEDRSASLYMGTGLVAVAAEKALTVKNCTVNAVGGMLIGLVSVSVDNISLTSLTLLSAIAAIPEDDATQTKIYCKNSDLTIGGVYPFIATGETVLENCVTHVTVMSAPPASNGIAPIEVKGGSIALGGWNSSDLDLSLFVVNDGAECALSAAGGRLYLSDKDTVSLPENIAFLDLNGNTVHTGALTEDMLEHEPDEDLYYIVVGEGEDKVYVNAAVTPYAADIEKAAVTTDAKVYEHDGKIQVTVKADGPAIGVHGNTRLTPASWKVGELSGTFEDGSNTFEIDASLLAAGEYTLEVTYRLEEAYINMNYGGRFPLLSTAWWDISDLEEDMVLTTSTTFTVKAKPVPTPTPDPEDNKSDDNKQNDTNQETPKPSLDGAKTGDSGAALPWLVLTVVSGVALIALPFVKKRKVTE